MRLLTELKRRKVFRVAAAYAVVAWVLIEVSDTVFPRLGLPEWTVTFVIALVVLGFPVALFLSWVYEFTPEGLQRETDMTADEAGEPPPDRPMDYLIMAGLFAVTVIAAIGVFWFAGTGSEEAPATTAEGAPAAIHDKSIAVLPFTDYSADGDKEWFADGLADEIRAALTRTPDLLVNARTSSFRHKNSSLDIREIAADLGVAYVLEGSVRMSAERIRVTAQLIRAADGFHLWSEHFDRNVAEMIEIQEDLARQIAMAMETTMDSEALADMVVVGARSVDAYQAYLQGRALAIPDPTSESYALFEVARTLDPGFAEAHFRAALYWWLQLDINRAESYETRLTPDQIRQNFVERIDQAIATAPTPAAQKGYRAMKASRELRLRGAIDLYRGYLAERPGEIAVWSELMLQAQRASDQAVLDEALETVLAQAELLPGAARLYLTFAWWGSDQEQVVDRVAALLARWPDQELVWYQAHRALLVAGEVELARGVAARYKQLPGAVDVLSMLVSARQACAEGRRVEVEGMLATVPEHDTSLLWLYLVMLGRMQEAADLLMPLERDGRTEALASFLFYPEFDPTPFPSLMRVLEREQVERSAPAAQRYACQG